MKIQMIFCLLLLANITLRSNGYENIEKQNPLETFSASDVNILSGCELVIPETINGFPVTNIGEWAYEYSTICSVTIPNGVTNISKGAFFSCSELESVIIPETMISIGSRAFEECRQLQNVQIPDGLIYLSSGVFYGCRNLASIYLPDTLVSIGNGTFGGCSKLMHVTFNASIHNIAPYTFSYCHSLQSINIPKTVNAIGSHAFSGALSLTAVIIPENVTYLGDWAFSPCRRLKNVVFLGDAPDLGFNVFDGADPELTIYYLAGKAGFTLGNYADYNAIEINGSMSPAAPWLLGYNLPIETDLTQDLNKDGVSLLVAYSLGLDPMLNLSQSLPKPVYENNYFSVKFPAHSQGIIYNVEVSENLKYWGHEGLNVIMHEELGEIEATISHSGKSKFLRINISTNW